MKNIILRRVGISFAILFFLVAVTAPAPIFANAKGGVNPGNTFYAFDIFFEKVDLALTFNKNKRIQKIMANTEERLAEAEEAVAENKPDIAEKALAKYQEGVSLAIVEAKGIDDKEKSKETLSIIGDNVLKHKDVLTAVYSSVPEISKESIEKVIAISATEQEETKEELDQVIISQQVNEDSVKAQKEAEKNIAVENQNKKEKKQETNININIAPKTKEKEIIAPVAQKQSSLDTVIASNDSTYQSVLNSPKNDKVDGDVASSNVVVPATPATPAVPAMNNIPAIPAVPATPASPSNSNKSSSQGDTVPPVISNIQTVNIGEISATSTWTTDELSSGEFYYALSSIAVATSTVKLTGVNNTTSHVINLTNLSANTTYYYIVVSKDATGNTSTSSEQSFKTLESTPSTAVRNDNLGPWITNLSISPTNINPGGLVTFAVTAEDPNGIGSIVVDIKYPPCACHDSDYYLRPNFNFSGATSGTQTFTETIDHGTSPTILGDYAIVTIRAVDSLGNISTYYPNGIVTGAKQGTHTLTIPVINVSEPVQSSSSVSSSSPSSLSVPQFILKWGTLGAGDGQFKDPWRVAVDNSGNVYVADATNYRVQKFTSAGTFLTKWGSEGAENGQFDLPRGIIVDNSGNVYVADRNNNRIQKFDASGAFLSSFGNYGTANGQFNHPAGMALDTSGNIYVVDADNHRIQKFDSSGIFVLKWGIYGSENGQFNTPRGIAIDSNNNVFIADTDSHRIQKFTSNGVFITKWGSLGQYSDGTFTFPEDVAVDMSGNVYVTGRDDHRIQKFTNDGAFVTKWGGYGTGDGQFQYPEGIAVDGAGNIYIGDRSNHRIQKFVQ